MTLLRVAHTADLDGTTLRAARALLYEVFEEDMTESDWEHALGGMHALAWDGDVLVGHASLIQRRMLHGGRALRTGYVEGVAVRAGYRRLGYASALMAPLERIIGAAYQLGVLGASDEGASFYASRGWQLWKGPLSALTPTGIQRTREEEGYVYFLPGSVPVDHAAELTCDWRDGDVW